MLVDPNGNRLQASSSVTIRRELIGQRIGRFTPADMAPNVALAFVMGLRISSRPDLSAQF